MKTLKFNTPDSAIKITREQAIFLGITDISADEVRGEIKSRGVWQIPTGYKALAMSSIFGRKDENSFFDERLESTFYGVRTMTDIKQGGYELNGRVSIGGKKYTCFTSSQLFDIDGHLIDVAVIHARVSKKDKTIM